MKPIFALLLLLTLPAHAAIANGEDYTRTGHRWVLEELTGYECTCHEYPNGVKEFVCDRSEALRRAMPAHKIGRCFKLRYDTGGEK